MLDVAVQVMAEQGVAGLTLGEVARRMGIRPPSLYVYFDSKNALYDALFERGWRLLHDTIRPALDADPARDPIAMMQHLAAVSVRWAVEHPGYAPLMGWRPVPGFHPSAAAYAPATEVEQSVREVFLSFAEGGLVPAGTDIDLMWRTWTAVTMGVITQQLANAPGEAFETGTFTSILPDVVAMWLAYHGVRPASGAGRDHPEPPGSGEASR